MGYASDMYSEGTQLQSWWKNRKPCQNFRSFLQPLQVSIGKEL